MPLCIDCKYVTASFSWSSTSPHVLWSSPLSPSWHRTLNLITIIQAPLGAPFRTMTSTFRNISVHLMSKELWVGTYHHIVAQILTHVFHVWWLLKVLRIYFVCILFILPRWFREAGGIKLPLLWYLKPVICEFPRAQCWGESQENSDALSIISQLYSLPMFLPLIYFNWAESPLEMLVMSEIKKTWAHGRRAWRRGLEHCLPKRGYSTAGPAVQSSSHLWPMIH